MKNRIYYIFRFIFILLVCQELSAQSTYTTNTNPIGLEYNLLFKANTNYSITQSGSAQYSNDKGLFDGKLYPQYTSVAPTYEDPYVVLIEGLPSVHIQTGGWIGWTTRYWGASKFKIEGYNSYSPSGIGWKTLVDYSTTNYSGNNFMTPINLKGTYTKVRYTFYEATGRNGRLGLSELVFLHPEATSPYENLIEDSSIWSENNLGISYDGNVGIGTDVPANKLDVKVSGSTNFKTYDYGSEITVQSNGGWARALRIRNEATNSNVAYGVHNGDAYIATGFDINVGPVGHTFKKFIVKSNGNVGIGMDDPLHVLDVNGNPRFNTTASNHTQIRLGREDYDAIIADNSPNEYYGGGYFFRVNDDTMASNYRDVLMLAKTGQIGIGTRTMGSHKLAVEGSIGAREIKVQAVDWSDFVFEEDYNLPSLHEVERHIEVNGHLQDIPSAKEVAENGIFLGEMDSKLLQKIEELMLYTIEQQKQIELLKLSNQSFRDELDSYKAISKN